MDNEFTFLICYSILIDDHVTIQNLADDLGCLVCLPRPVFCLHSYVTTPRVSVILARRLKVTIASAVKMIACAQ